ncbi:hypothetical protein V6N11_006746 [Hibiscus sabdariffa]|uniref:Uncharacterized protein n=1 Tax=Hibiscus sabdariffa TaxID=183260 RepID=A0ABR2RSB6_9ROSI
MVGNPWLSFRVELGKQTNRHTKVERSGGASPLSDVGAAFSVSKKSSTILTQLVLFIYITHVGQSNKAHIQQPRINPLT